MLSLGDKVRIKDNNLTGEICDINGEYCYVDVNVNCLGNIKPDFMDNLFERRLEEVEKSHKQ